MMIWKPTISIGAVGAALGPTAAFVLHDLVFQLPDNQHEASPAFLMTVAGLVFVWALGGYLAGRRTRSVMNAITAGMATATISVGILWLTFMTLNLIFTERMSYEPDRIRAFRASGYRTMRAYLVHSMTPGPFPLVLGVAVVAGIAGSCLGEKMYDRAA